MISPALRRPERSWSRFAGLGPSRASIPLAVITAVAALVRLASLGKQSLSTDEGYTLAFTQHGFLGMLRLFRDEPNGLLYQLLAYPLARLDESERMLRAPAAVAGVLVVPALYWAGCRLAGRSVALLAAALLAVSPFAVQESQNARPYTLVMLMATLSFGCLARALDESRLRWWLLYGLALAAAAYGNALALALLLLPQAVLVVAHRPGVVRRWVLTLAGTALLLVPLAILLVLDRTHRNPLYWLGPLTLKDLAAAEAALFGGKPAALLALILLAAAALARHAAVPRHPLDVFRHPVLPIALWAFSPAVIAFLAGLLTRRYTTEAVPGACLLLAYAIVRLQWRVAVGTAAVALILSVVTVVAYTRTAVASEWRAAMTTLGAARAPGDPVVFDTAEGIVAAGFYARAFAAPDGHLVVNEWHDESVPADVVLLQDPRGYSEAPFGPPTPALIRRLVARTGRAFIVFVYVSAGKQGNVLRGSGVGWARRHCRVQESVFTPGNVDGIEEGSPITLVRISNCRA